MEGFLTVTGVSRGGKRVSNQEAVDRGWITPAPLIAEGWGLDKTEVPLGANMFVDAGRQMLAYAFGFRNPVGDYTCQSFAIGTGTTAASAVDVYLENMQPMQTVGESPTFFKRIAGISYPAPLIAMVELTLGENDANGLLVTELGLFSGNETLMARKTLTAGINKSDGMSISLGWRIRF